MTICQLLNSKASFFVIKRFDDVLKKRILWWFLATYIGGPFGFCALVFRTITDLKPRGSMPSSTGNNFLNPQQRPVWKLYKILQFAQDLFFRLAVCYQQSESDWVAALDGWASANLTPLTSCLNNVCKHSHLWAAASRMAVSAKIWKNWPNRFSFPTSWVPNRINYN